MYHLAFREVFQSPTFALVLTGIFVIVCQLKINVTNAYAGSIAWSNFFSRLTHSHPGRVVWLVFNVLLALLLMEIGIFRAIESILVIYANFAAGWIGALTADLVINKPLGFSPKYIEFKRAHLYDINPVGVGALVDFRVAVEPRLHGRLRPIRADPFALRRAVRGLHRRAADRLGHERQVLPGAAAPTGLPEKATELECSICENVFERGDIAMCPAYSGPICSLCCTLEARCRDQCKTNSRFNEQLDGFISARAAEARGRHAEHACRPLRRAAAAVQSRHRTVVRRSSTSSTAGRCPRERETIRTTLWLVYFALLVVSGVMAWLIVLAHESRRAAEAESARQTAMLMDEIDAHKRTDAALQKAKEVAEAANVAKTRYIAGISHEIRTPLNSIYGYAQLLERGAAGPSDNAIRVIRRSAEHLTDLIDGILDISKIENGILRLNRDKIALAEFLDQIVDMFRLQAAAKGIDFVYSRPPNLPAYVHVDQKRLRQILINLLSNAIKYTERGSATLTVRYRSQVAEFEVADTGVGIPANELERVFEPFERGQGVNVRAIPGTGLGLTITKLLTQIMGGEINATSTEGAGTTFTVRLLVVGSRAVAACHQGWPCRCARGHQLHGKSPQGAAHRRRSRTHRHRAESARAAALRAAHGARRQARTRARRRAQAGSGDGGSVDARHDGLAGSREPARVARACKVSRSSSYRPTPMSSRPAAPGAVHDAFLIKPIDMQRMLECLAAQLGLLWVYEGGASTAVTRENDLQSALPEHSRHHVDDLYQLGLIGHVRGIQAKLREMETDPTNKPFATRMRTLVANFDLKRYMNVLEGMRKHG